MNTIREFPFMPRLHAIAALALAFFVTGPAMARPTCINNEGELALMRATPGDSFILCHDLNLTGLAFTPIGDSMLRFTGSFDGNGFVINGLTVGACGSGDSIGFFGEVQGATLTNVKLTNVDVRGDERVGALAGFVYDETVIQDCDATGVVRGRQEVGGLVGRMEHHCDMLNCTAHDTVLFCTSGDEPGKWHGGLVGHVHIGCMLDSCSATGSVTGDSICGGLTGNLHGSVMTNCLASGQVQGQTMVGGLTGYIQRDNLNTPPNETAVLDCTASGNVTSEGLGRPLEGRRSSGGLAGWAEATSTISNSSATGSVTVGNQGLHPINNVGAGGLIGLIEAGVLVSNCTATGAVSSFRAGGLVGWCNGRIEYSLASGAVSSTNLSHMDGTKVGGLVAFLAAGGEVIGSHAYGNVTGVVTGGLVAWNEGLIDGCSAGGTVDGVWETGGLVGACQSVATSDSGVVRNSFSTSPLVTASGFARNSHATCGKLAAAAGGLVGYLFPGSIISDCSSSANVDSDGEYTGGLIGFHWDSTVERCAAFGTVSSTEGSLGGLIGGIREVTGSSATNGTRARSGGVCSDSVTPLAASPGSLSRVSDCYSMVSVTYDGSTSGTRAYAGVGGLIGNADPDSIESTQTRIERCYATGLVTSAHPLTGGLIGKRLVYGSYDADVIDCVWDYQTTNKTSSDGGTALSTTNMQLQSTFLGLGWDMTTVWDIFDGETYPFFRRIPCAADFNQDGSVEGADVEAFFLAWGSGAPDADVNHDGGVDGADVDAFFVLWEAGGC